MSIEQTNQLILLILNSVLMALLSSILLGGTWLRQNALLKQLNQVRSHYRHLTHATETNLSNQLLEASELKQVREHRQRLSYQYQWSRVGLLMLHIAVLVFCVSLLALALRSLLAFDALISTALFLFTLGAIGLLTGTGCILVDFAQGNSNGDSLGRAFGQIMQQIARQWSHHRASRKLGLGAHAATAKVTSTPEA